MNTRYIALLAGLLLAAGCNDNTPTEPSPDEVTYTAIGASDAIGFGGTVVCIPFSECPNGSGYVQQLVRRLESAGRDVDLNNLGLPGGVLSPDTQALGNSIGREVLTNFLQQQMPFVRASTVVTVFAGANDVNVIGEAIKDGRGGADPTNYITSQIQKFGSDMRTLITGIKERAPSARIVALNLPNMAAFPYVATRSITEKRWLQTIAVGFSKEINALTSQGVIVVDLMCNGGFYSSGLISGDGFHPNDSGYTFLADALYPAVSAGTSMTPPASCGQMTIF
jgi:lysophospholipase L1-like esterase